MPFDVHHRAGQVCTQSCSRPRFVCAVCSPAFAERDCADALRRDACRRSAQCLVEKGVLFFVRRSGGSRTRRAQERAGRGSRAPEPAPRVVCVRCAWRPAPRAPFRNTAVARPYGMKVVGMQLGCPGECASPAPPHIAAPARPAACSDFAWVSGKAPVLAASACMRFSRRLHRCCVCSLPCE